MAHRKCEAEGWGKAACEALQKERGGLACFAQEEAAVGRHGDNLRDAPEILVAEPWEVVFNISDLPVCPVEE